MDSKMTLQQYLDQQITDDQLADWLAGAEYDPDLPQDERDALAGVRLMVIEPSEGLRPVEDILTSVQEALALASTASRSIVKTGTPRVERPNH